MLFWEGRLGEGQIKHMNSVFEYDNKSPARAVYEDF
jgi:hypothetical protein